MRHKYDRDNQGDERQAEPDRQPKPDCPNGADCPTGIDNPTGDECQPRADISGKATRKHGKKASRTQKLLLAAAVLLVLNLVAVSVSFTLLFFRPAGGFSNRPVSVTVPDLSGMTEDEAKAQLTDATSRDKPLFSLSLEYDYDDNLPRGTVLSQSPSPGSRRKATPGLAPCPVTLRISLGEKTQPLPELSGKTIREARDQLASLGFAVRTVTDRETVTGESVVLSSSPAAGTPLKEGGTVTLTVSRAQPPLRTASVPDLVGLTRSRAEVLLVASGFLVGTVEEQRTGGGYPSGDGTVVSQQYLPGTSMIRGTEVGFRVEYSAGSAADRDRYLLPHPFLSGLRN